MKLITILTSLLILSLGVFGQNTPLLKPTEVSVHPFLSSGFDEPLKSQEVERLILSEDLITQELIEELENTPSFYYGYMGVPDMGLNLSLGLKIRNKETNEYFKSPVLRLGLQYRTITAASSYSRIKNTYRVDTLIAASSNSTVYVDSVSDVSLDINKRTELINLDVSVIFRTDTSKLWSLYGGAGLSTGVSINSYTEVNVQDNSYYQFSGDYSPESNGNSFYMNRWENNYERHENKANFMANIYFPIGIDVRLGQKTAFWRRLHLFYEARPGVSMLTVPELGTVTRFSVMHGMGLMVRF